MSDVLAIKTVRFISDSSGTRVFQFRELHQNVRHLVAAFTAADVYYDVGVRPLCKLVLHNRLS